jgi:hypothetical protein
MELKIKVICEDLPGISFLDVSGGKTLTRDQIHIGIQRGDEVVNAVPANRKRVVFEPEFRVSPLPDGKTNFLGPYAKGTPTERFFYLSWVEKGERGALTMFRRAKIHLTQLRWSQVEEAMRSGRVLSVRLSLRDKRGGPRCGSIRGENVSWQLSEERTS